MSDIETSHRDDESFTEEHELLDVDDKEQPASVREGLSPWLVRYDGCCCEHVGG